MLIRKKRKDVSGSLRNKTKTKERLIEGVGRLLEDDTYTGLSISTFYTKLRLNPKLIYLYFQSFENLVAAFLEQKLAHFDVEARLERRKHRVAGKDEIVEVIIAQLEKFQNDEVLKKLFHWGLVEKRNKLLKALLNSYMDHFMALFKFFMRDLSLQEKKELTALLDLLLSGTFFLSVHNAANEDFLGINMTVEADRKRVYDTLRRLLLHNGRSVSA